MSTLCEIILSHSLPLTTHKHTRTHFLSLFFALSLAQTTYSFSSFLFPFLYLLFCTPIRVQKFSVNNSTLKNFLNHYKISKTKKFWLHTHAKSLHTMFLITFSNTRYCILNLYFSCLTDNGEHVWCSWFWVYNKREKKIYYLL